MKITKINNNNIMAITNLNHPENNKVEINIEKLKGFISESGQVIYYSEEPTVSTVSWTFEICKDDIKDTFYDKDFQIERTLAQLIIKQDIHKLGYKLLTNEISVLEGKYDYFFLFKVEFNKNTEVVFTNDADKQSTNCEVCGKTKEECTCKKCTCNGGKCICRVYV